MNPKRIDLVRGFVDGFASRWTKALPVNIAGSASELPGGKVPDDVLGMFDGIQVHIVASQPISQVPGVLNHEMVGHFGLRKLLGRDWPHFMRGVQLGASTDASLADIRDAVRAAYRDESGQQYLSRAGEADEIAAATAEILTSFNGELLVDRPAMRAAAAVKGLLIREGLCVDRPVTREELEGALLLSELRLRGWPLHPLKEGYGRITSRWRSIRPMLDRYKPPMSLQESERLIHGAKSSEGTMDTLKGAFSALLVLVMWIGGLALIGVALFIANGLFGTAGVIGVMFLVYLKLR